MRKVWLVAVLVAVFSSGCNGGGMAGAPAATHTKGASQADHASPGGNPNPPLPTQPGSLGVADVVTKLQAKGLEARATGEKVKELFGALRVEVVVADGTPIQVYVCNDVAAAEQALRTASDPQANTVSWAITPQFMRMGNLMITVASENRSAVARIVGALQ